MTGFWESSIGEVTGNASDAFAKVFMQIPDGTMALAKIESFKNDDYEGHRFLSLNWVISEGVFKGQKVNQKIKVYGDPNAKNPEYAHHRALNMLKLIYTLYSYKPTHSGEPTDTDLRVFVGKAGGIKIQLTDANEKGNRYNWVSEVHKAEGFKPEVGIETKIQPRDSAFDRQKGVQNDEIEDDIPF